MNKKTRRNVLKGLAVTLPATWAKPVVNSVVLPAHGGTTLTCPAGCYTDGADSYRIINPAYGLISNAVLHPQSTTCSALQTSQQSVVLAMNLNDANDILDAETGGQCSLNEAAYSLEGSPCMVWEFGCGG